MQGSQLLTDDGSMISVIKNYEVRGHGTPTHQSSLRRSQLQLGQMIVRRTEKMEISVENICINL